MSDPKNYTVGWICAITTEYVAARAFLDEVVHDGPQYVSEHDNNDYTLGKVGKHNVVIAVLPDGEYGTSSAASVASGMLHSFPNVRISLMVGIGGGAPSTDHDIRLGDVVVSSPRDGNGGVFQYDFGKTIQDQSFRLTGYLNQPPVALRAAVNGLKAQYKEDGHRIEEAINSILGKKPRIREEYKRPDPSSDRLYQAGAAHPPGNRASCAAVCGYDPSNLIIRRERTEIEDNPAIHYGLIASGNQLMKDALVRDSLAKEKDILCFEMEAAGLMNHFPCLVIRGICDYADSHKNKEWQGYAAMSAAAYAKDLLSRIAPNRVEAERKISDILSSVEKDVNEIRSDVQDAKNAVKGLGFEQRCEKIERWLSPPDPSTNHNRALQQRQEGTGLWFLHSDAFAKWQIQRNSFLWLYGIPGCGKTILSSTIIEHLEKALPHQPFLYFYFDFNDTSKQSLDGMVRSLVSQLYYKREDTQKLLDSLFSSCNDGRRQPTRELLCKSLLDMIEQTGEVWIVLDALDECTTRRGLPTEGLLSWIRGLLDTEKRNVRLLVTSRLEHDIESEVGELAHNNIVPIHSDLITDDIRAYIGKRVREGKGFMRWQTRPSIQREIESGVMEKTNGMFRWAACQLDILENCPDRRMLRSTLASLPDTLHETYTRILRAIPSEYKQNATRILQFLVFSERPLRIEEAVDALAVDPNGDPRFDTEDRMPDPREISRYCSSLVVVTTKEGIYGEDTIVELHLAHFSVKEYLMLGRPEEIARDFEEVAARASIAIVCLAYLLHLDFILTAKEIRERFPLAQYCARYWTAHATIAESKSETLQSFIKEFLCNHKNSYRNCYSLYRPDWPWDNTVGRQPASALYYASLGGLVNAVKDLLNQNADVNTQSGKYGSALQAASVEGHDKIVELLLSRGADANTLGGLYGTALQAASSRGHEKVIGLLLSKGADVNVGGGGYSTALYAASDGGHDKVVELLLSKGADVNAQSECYGTALQAVSARGREKIIELLLSKGADVNAQGGRYGTALQVASAEGHEKIIEPLLSKGADVNAQNGYYGTALQAASARGYERIIELLLSKGVDVNAQGGRYGTALQAASVGGHDKVVELLLSKGADFNAQSGYHGTALQAASTGGHEKIIELLLSKGADINGEGGKYGTAPQAASSKGLIG
ncbi:hypothetical protein GP486_005768 [Trichoglossum hirsutum]|uniref:NACHT domain-containing protein n=1 Tax=Trichoglossum hirsutum TaxID=265104 RepID=A0A9P8L8K4_9PEZI|nr:hypothetical protein GP486_005768 [Trichoglossum hirsutum]